MNGDDVNRETVPPLLKRVGLRLLALHNLRYLQRFTANMREAILADKFSEFREKFFTAYVRGDDI